MGRRRVRYQWDAESVRSLRKHLDMTQQQMSDELGTRQQTISEWETGMYRPRGGMNRLLTLVAERAGFEYETKAAMRVQLEADETNRPVDSKPDGLVSTEVADPRSAYTEAIDLLEIRLRDFINHRLTTMVSPRFWKQTMPGDVAVAVKERISEWLSRHPYADQSQFAAARTRLDFCDVSHYEKIILSNWVQFAEFFQRKDEFQRHMGAYRRLRNCVQHNREPTDIEQQLGETAITWLRRILAQYEQEILAHSEEGEKGGSES